ncbi:hypothetical protein NHG34_06675 [Aerococcaceae bacterium NML190938]|nr:hypothetical protein [Aerococcaceae bacterium NML190938]
MKSRKGDSMRTKIKLGFLSILVMMHLPVHLWANTLESELSAMEKQIEILEKQVEEAIQQDNAPKDTSKPIGTRHNPVPFGQNLTIEQKDLGLKGGPAARFNFKIEEVKRGQDALDYFHDAFASYTPLPKELEWVAMKVNFDYLSGDEEQPYITYLQYRLFDIDGKEIRPNYDYYATLDPSEAFEDQGLFPKNSHAGYIAFVVPRGIDFLFVYDSIEANYFFLTDQIISEATQELEDKLVELKQTYKQKQMKLWGTKSYPVPVGNQIEVEEAVQSTDSQEVIVKYLYGITDILRGRAASDIVGRWLPELSPPSNENEWALALIDMEYLEDYSNTPFFSIANMDVHTETGKVIPQSEHYILRDFGFINLNKGSAGQAIIAFQVPKDESFQFVYNVELEKYYFSGEIEE